MAADHELGEPNPKDLSENVDQSDQRPSKKDQERLAADRLDEVRQYFKDRQARREVVTVTTTPPGRKRLTGFQSRVLPQMAKWLDPPDENGLDLRSINKIPLAR